MANNPSPVRCRACSSFVVLRLHVFYIEKHFAKMKWIIFALVCCASAVIKQPPDFSHGTDPVAHPRTPFLRTAVLTAFAFLQAFVEMAGWLCTAVFTASGCLHARRAV